MLRQTTQAKPDLLELVDNIINEESRERIQDRRGAGRQPFSRPVEIVSGEKTVRAVTKDISPLGVGLISDGRVDPNSTARLKIYRHKGHPSVVIAECRWCEEHPSGWFVSGWFFINVVRS